MKKILFISGLIFLISQSSEACTCAIGAYSNFQQASQKPNVIVAKVKTLKSSYGKAQVKIEKFYKNTCPETEITVLGQDGGNCNGYNIIPSGKTGVLAFYKTAQGNYETLSCADTSLLFTSDNKVQINLGEDFTVTEQELQDIIDYKVQASVKQFSCRFQMSRVAVSDNQDDSHWDMDYSETFPVEVPKDEYTFIRKDMDLSNLGPNIFNLYYYVRIYRDSATNYKIMTSLIDPFTGITISDYPAVINLKSTLISARLYLARYSGMDGSPSFNPNDPFLFHSTSAYCYAVQGAPLEPVW